MRTEIRGPQGVAEAVTGNRHEEVEAPGEDEQIPEDVVDEVGTEAGEATIPTTIPTTTPPSYVDYDSTGQDSSRYRNDASYSQYRFPYSDWN